MGEGGVDLEDGLMGIDLIGGGVADIGRVLALVPGALIFNVCESFLSVSFYYVCVTCAHLYTLGPWVH